MKPPVNIDDLLEEWSKDATIDETEPSRETAKVPNLHAKYLRILTHHNLVVKKLMSDYNRMRRIKFEYYSGDLNNTEDLEKYGLEPMTKRLLKQEVPTYLDSDIELNNILSKKVVHEEIVEFCKSVLKEISNRTWQLGNIIKWEQFVGGR